MPDNVAITAGTGTSIATDLIGSDHYQRVKVAWGADGTAADASTTNPLPVTGAFTLTGEDHIGEVGGRSGIIQPVITNTTATAYAAGDVFGGKITLTNALRKVGGTGVLQSISIVDLDNVKSPFTILIYASDPVSGTYTNDAAYTSNTTDAARVLGKVKVAAADYDTLGGDAFAMVPFTPFVVWGNATANLYAVIIIPSGSPTFPTTQAVKFTFGFLQD